MQQVGQADAPKQPRLEQDEDVDGHGDTHKQPLTGDERWAQQASEDQEVGEDPAGENGHEAGEQQDEEHGQAAETTHPDSGHQDQDEDEHADTVTAEPRPV